MRQSSLFTVFLIVFIDLLGFGIVIPILPYYAQQYGASAWALGWLMTSYSLMQFLFSPIWGRISDFIGRRPVLLISILGSSLSMFLLASAGSLEWLFIGRILAGFFAANISTAYAYISDVTTEENRAKGMGVIGAGFGLGFVFGPAIGGLLSRYGYGAPMLFGAFLGLVNLAFAFFKLQEPKIAPEVRATHRFKRFDWAAYRNLLLNSRTLFAVSAFLLLTFAVTQMEVTFAIYMDAKYGYDATAAGILLAVMGAIMALVQGGLIGRLARRFGEIRLVLYGSLLCSAALAAFAWTTSENAVIASLVLLAFGHGAVHPSLSSLASKGAAKEQRGTTMGIFQSAGSLARILGPPCAGWLYDHVSWQSPFYFGALVLGFCAFLTWSWAQRTQATPRSQPA